MKYTTSDMADLGRTFEEACAAFETFGEALRAEGVREAVEQAIAVTGAAMDMRDRGTRMAVAIQTYGPEFVAAALDELGYNISLAR